LRCIEQQAFSDLDFTVMQNVFKSHNRLGRLCDEAIYQNDLVARLGAEGFPVEKEVPVTVSHRDFAKQFRLDMVVANAAIYELKTTSALTSEHDAQLLHYLFLCGSHHGKLVNLRPPKVKSRFVNATLTLEERRRFQIDRERWLEGEESDHLFFRTLVGLLEDWGTCLELALYVEAICYFLGGEERLAQPVKLARDGMDLGSQRLHLLTRETAFRLTAMPEQRIDYEQSLLALLCLSPLRAIHWVNLDRHRVEFVTLTKRQKKEEGRKMEAEK